MRPSLWLVCCVLGASGSAWACRYQPQPMADSVKSAELVFVGRIEKLEGQLGTFVVEAAFKGTTTGATVAVRTNETSCGLRFSLNERWLMLASKVDGQWSSSLPSNSRYLTDPRGLQQPEGWETVRTVLTDAQLEPLLKGNACLKARAELMAFIERLPHDCAVDADCAAQYLDVHACYPPVVTRASTEKRPVPSKPQEAELIALQKAAGAACPLQTAAIPACAAQLRVARCSAKRCAAQQP